MNILHIQTALTGTGNAPYRLHKALELSGLKSTLLNYRSFTESENIICCERDSAFHRYVNGKFCALSLWGKKEGTYYYSPTPYLKHKDLNYNALLNADVILLHWTHNLFLNIRNYEEVFSFGKPVVLFLHDMWYITGGCNHSLDCDNYKINCRSCPLFSCFKIGPYIQFINKKRLYQKYKNIHFLSFSQWMNSKLVEGCVYSGANNYILPPYIDNKTFYPIDKKDAKRALGIDLNKKVISFGSVGALTNVYKGWKFLRQALKRFENDNVQLLIFGNDCNDLIDFNIHTTYLGIITDETKMNLVNSASDVFVSPTLVESYGMAIMENLLCNTPVVAFNSSSVPELVEHKVNGYLARYKDEEDLYTGIKYVLENINVMDKNVRLTDYCSDLVLQRYIEFLSSVTSKK